MIYFIMISSLHRLIVLLQVYTDRVKQLVRCGIYLVDALLIYCLEQQ